jgi:hypothetical protein
MEEKPWPYDDADAELARENQALEEELKLLGEPVEMQPAADPKLHNEFLKQILAFHGMERGPQVPMRSLFPDEYEFPPVDTLSDAELEAKLDEILRILGEHTIVVDLIDKLPDRLTYKYLTEEVIPEDMVAAENPTGMRMHIDGCTGGCDDCFQKDYCETAKEVLAEELGDKPHKPPCNGADPGSTV